MSGVTEEESQMLGWGRHASGEKVKGKENQHAIAATAAFSSTSCCPPRALLRGRGGRVSRTACPVRWTVRAGAGCTHQPGLAAALPHPSLCRRHSCCCSSPALLSHEPQGELWGRGRGRERTFSLLPLPLVVCESELLAVYWARTSGAPRLPPSPLAHRLAGRVRLC